MKNVFMILCAALISLPAFAATTTKKLMTDAELAQQNPPTQAVYSMANAESNMSDTPSGATCTCNASGIGPSVATSAVAPVTPTSAAQPNTVTPKGTGNAESHGG